MKKLVHTPQGDSLVDMTPAEIDATTAIWTAFANDQAAPKLPSIAQVAEAIISSLEGDNTKLQAVKAARSAWRTANGGQSTTTT